MPPGVEPFGVRFEPEWMVPLAMTVTLSLEVSEATWLWALMPLLPEFKMSPADVVTLTLPTSLVNAWMAKIELPVIVALAATLTAILPAPLLFP